MSNFRSWILDAIPRESAKLNDIEVNYVYVPVSRREVLGYNSFVNYFFPRLNKFNLFIHHRTFLFVANRSDVSRYRNRIWLTHFDDFRDIGRLLVYKQSINKIFVQNSTLAKSLIDSGFSSEQISIQPGAIDRSVFHPPLLPGSHDSYFLFSGDCKPRKNPEFIEWLILNFPEIDFVIHGRGWNDFKNGSFNSFTNLKIYDFDFSKQATFLRNALALIIVSSNEGGPVSLLESLACGTPVLSTNNGFAPDFIDSNNGLIVRLDQSTDEWFRYFEIAKKLKENVGRTDLLNRPLTWNKLGSELYE